MKVLIVLTSHSELGNTGQKTGFWIEEFATPYYEMIKEGIQVTLSSPKGGQPPVDPQSETQEAQTPSSIRYQHDWELKYKLAHTEKLSDMNQANFDAVFYPGGHGPMWDLVNDKSSAFLIQDFYNHNKPVALVCHAPAALINVKLPGGESLIKGKMLTGFSNTEEEAVKLTNVVPFSLEDELTRHGAVYCKGNDWTSFVKTDGLLITGQNPASSEEVARLLIQMLKNDKVNQHVAKNEAL